MATALKRSRGNAPTWIGLLAVIGAVLPRAALAQGDDKPLAYGVPAVSPNVRYTVLPGDNLFRLATNYLIRPDDYRIVQRLNRVADPMRLPIGMILLFPRELLKQEPVRATVNASRGAVTIDGKPAGVGAVVSEGMLIQTGQKSFVTLILPDATSIVLPSQSAVRVQRMRKVVLDRHVERLFAIEAGQATARVTPMTDPRSTFQFATPGAITSVRGTQFRMGYDQARGVATSEVLEGKVGFEVGANDPQTLPAGFGSSSELAEPVELLPPPVLPAPAVKTAGAPAVAEGVTEGANQGEATLQFIWAPLAGARSYHLQLAADAVFLKVIDETVVTQPAAQLPAQPNGRYFMRVTGIDGHGLEGRPAVMAFERRRNAMRLWVEQDWRGEVHHYQFRWDADDNRGTRYRFQLFNAGKEKHPLVDQGDLGVNVIEGFSLPHGRYRWRVEMTQTIDGRTTTQWTPYNELRVEDGW